jgi:hypothetical protein
MPASATKIEVLYAVPANYKTLQEQLAADFYKQHPDIAVKRHPHRRRSDHRAYAQLSR